MLHYCKSLLLDWTHRNTLVIASCIGALHYYGLRAKLHHWSALLSCTGMVPSCVAMPPVLHATKQLPAALPAAATAQQMPLKPPT